jgi:hypothetical protein
MNYQNKANPSKGIDIKWLEKKKDRLEFQKRSQIFEIDEKPDLKLCRSLILKHNYYLKEVMSLVEVFNLKKKVPYEIFNIVRHA